MSSTLTAERVRGDVDVLSRGGLDLDTFIAESVASLGRAVPFVSACVATHDAATHILTGARKYGDLAGQDHMDGLFGIIEYDSDEQTSYRILAGTDVRAIGLHATTGGDVERSERMSRLMVPAFGYHDEVRMVFRSGGRHWGGMALFRGVDDLPFSLEEIDYLGSLSEIFGRGLRSGLLTRSTMAVQPAQIAGPAVIIVGARDEILQSSPAAAAWLATLVYSEHSADPFGVISALVGAARALARGHSAVVPRARVRTDTGTWLVLRASPMSGLGDRDGEVVVTIEEARPPEIVSLVVEAFDLTSRERAVTQLVLQGVDTKEIATTLHLSAYTVQDHLKSIFDKAGVRSRRELISRVFFDQYAPRMGADVGPSGWFAAR